MKKQHCQDSYKYYDMSSTPSNVERDKLLPDKLDNSGPHDVHPQLHPFFHLHEGQVINEIIFEKPFNHLMRMFM